MARANQKIELTKFGQVAEKDGHIIFHDFEVKAPENFVRPPTIGQIYLELAIRHLIKKLNAYLIENGKDQKPVILTLEEIKPFNNEFIEFKIKE